MQVAAVTRHIISRTFRREFMTQSTMDVRQSSAATVLGTEPILCLVRAIVNHCRVADTLAWPVSSWRRQSSDINDGTAALRREFHRRLKAFC